MTRTPGAKPVDDAVAVALDGVGSESIKVKKPGRTERAGNPAFGVWLPKFPHAKSARVVSCCHLPHRGTPNTPLDVKKQHNTSLPSSMAFFGLRKWPTPVSQNSRPRGIMYHAHDRFDPLGDVMLILPPSFCPGFPAIVALLRCERHHLLSRLQSARPWSSLCVVLSYSKVSQLTPPLFPLPTFPLHF